MKTGLTIGDRGPDIERLHRTLSAAGHAIAPAERDAGEFGASTAAALAALRRERGLPDRDDIDESLVAVLLEIEQTVVINIGAPAPAPDPAPSADTHRGLVTGRLTDRDGAALPEAPIALLSMTVRGAQVLHEGRTDHAGRFSLHYARPRPLNLAVRALGPAGEDLATSPTAFAAAAAIVIDLTTAPDGVVRPPSEFTALGQAVAAALDGVAITALEEHADSQQISFLASAIQKPFQQVAFLFIAEALGRAHDLQPQTFYGLFRTGTPGNLAAALQSLPTDGVDDAFIAQVLSSLLSHADGVLSRSLTNAVDSGLLPASYADVQARELAGLAALRVTAVGAAPYVRGKTPLNDLLGAGGVASRTQAAFVAAYAANNGGLGSTWKALRADESLSKADLDALSATLDTGELLTGNLPLVKDTLARLADGSLAGLSALAAFDQADWEARIREVDPQAETIPQVLPGDGPADRIARFALSLQGRFAARYPTAAFAGALAKADASPFRQREALGEFLTAHQAFNLRSTNVDQYLAANQVDLPAPAVAELKTAQRLHRVAPFPAHVDALLSAGYASAQAIYAKGRAPFLAEMSGALGKTQAATTFARAQMAHGASLALLARHNGAFNQANPAAVAAPAADPALLSNLPDLQALFGSLDSFQCDDCQSIYSPAAYLVDLLQYLSGFAAQILVTAATDTNPIVVATALDHGLATGATVTITDVTGNAAANGTHVISVIGPRTFSLDGVAGSGAYAGGGQVAAPGLSIATARDALFLRRPEIQYVGLSCDNTNTVIPYIDLANEILERAVAGVAPPNAAIETVGTTAERRALPQQTQPAVAAAAYDAAKAALFPLTLPFDQDFARTTGYLSGLGGGRARLLGLFASTTPAAAIAGAALGLNDAMRAVITQADPLTPWMRWGLDQTPAVVIDPATRQPYAPVPADWVQALNRVPVLMSRAGLNLGQLFQLLEATWVTRGAVTLQLGVVVQAGLNILSPDTDLMVFTGLDADVLDRANRFLRLWTASGLTMWDLDRALETAGGTLDDAFLTFLSDATAVAAQLKIPLNEALAFWGPMGVGDVVSHLGDEDAVIPSTYAGVFRNPAVLANSGAVFPVLTQATVVGADNVSPIVVTTAAPHGFATGMLVTLAGVTGNTAANGAFTVTVIDTTHFSLDGSAGDGAWTGGGQATGPVADPAPSILAAGAAPTPVQVAISAALGLDAQDVAAIVDDSGAPPTLCLETLGVLLRYQRLAGALSLTIADLITWIGLTGQNPFGAAPAATREFLRRQGLLKGANAPLADLDYLLRGRGAGQSALAFTADQAAAVLQSIRDAAAKTVGSAALTLTLVAPGAPVLVRAGQPHGLATGDQVFVTGVTGTVAANGLHAITVTGPADFTLDGVSSAAAWTGGGGVVTDPAALMTAIRTGVLAALADATGASPAVIAPAVQAQPALALDYPTLQALLGQATVDPAQFPAIIAGLTRAAMAARLCGALNCPADVFAFVIAHGADFGLLDPSALPVGPVTATPYPAFEALLWALKLQKRQSARTPKLFDVLAAWATPGDLPADLATAIGGPALAVVGAAGTPIVVTTATPHGLADGAAVSINGVQGDAAANGVFTISTQGQPANAFILPGTASSGAYAAGGDVVALGAPAIAFALNAPIADVAAIAAALNVGTPSLAAATRPGTLADMGALTAIAAALDVARSGGISGATLAQLAAPVPDAATASAAMSAFQARFPQSAWLPAVQSVEDPLRQARRDALVAWLLGPGATTPAGAWFLTPDDLFNYYLIDPEMCACGETTRLLQPSLAIQQFVQQVFLNLTFGATVDSIDTRWKEWSWRRQYRLWQANREVFLYPENYLLPELRGNASPFFADLESDLKQSNCDADSTQAGLESYLRKLVGVSRLTVVGHFNEVSRASDGATVLHVVARTNGVPPQWWYRSRVTPSANTGGSSIGVWSAWTSLNLDIATDHVMPVVWDGRLHLFWPTFKLISEKAQDPKVPTGGGGSSPAARKFTAVQICMSEFSAGQWQAKRAYDQKMYFDTVDTDKAFTFKAIPQADYSLNIEVFFHDQNSIPGCIFYAAVGSLRYPDARLVVQQTSAWTNLIPPSDLVDTGLEPSYLTIQNVFMLYTVGGSIILPTPANYSTGGQTLVHGNWWDTYNPLAVPLYVTTAVTPAGGPGTFELLASIVDPRIVIPHQQLVFDSSDPFFVIDDARSYLVDPYYYTVSNSAQVDNRASSVQERSTGYRFSTFYHPYGRTLLRELETRGVDGLMRRDLQLDPQTARGWTPAFDFKALYQPQTCVARPFPGAVLSPPGTVGAADVGESWLDFDPAAAGAYSLYNWEIFYHAPMFIAAQLMQNQQYDAALTWLEYIFNPTDRSGGATPQRYWQMAPFNRMQSPDWTNQQITLLLQTLAADKAQNTPDPAMVNAIAAWMADPYDPHMVAGTRIAAYAKATVMKLLDLLLAQGDAYYAQYTSESVTLAEQCYVLGTMLLGPKPSQSRLPASQQAAAPTYASLAAVDTFSNVLVNVENLIIAPEPPQALVAGDGSAPSLPTLPGNGETLLFCIPPNAQMLAYWGQFEQRLYNVRHCLNLQGAAQPLPLYAPPINPLALIAARQSGVGGAGGVAAAPLYRFATYVQKAIELANDVRAFGGQILAALEKQDAETLAALRAAQELAIQTRMLDVKTQMATEAADQIVVLQNQQATAQLRADFYSSQSFMNAAEITAIALQGGALIANGVAMVLDLTAGVAYVTPKVTAGAAGFGGSPALTVSFGGENVGNAATKAASVSRTIAGILAESASMAATIGGYQRRQDEWGLQASLANSDIAQIKSQIQAATDHQTTALTEIAIQNQQIANAQAVNDFMTGKYTNAQLYSWMTTQLTTVYTQACQLAQSLALQAQVAYGYELGRPLDTFIQPSYWDSQYKGLTAGDALLFDLRRMETQYIANNLREQELSKTVSLALTRPDDLRRLLQTGSCTISLDETLFDHDHPGQYFRRVRSVAVTIPCVTGPYTGIHATLSLDQAVVRTAPPASPYASFQWSALPPAGSYPAGLFASPPLAAAPIIALSHGQNDSGLFEANLRDERWLPFEGQGMVSTWTLTLDPRDNDFDISTVTDVLMHLRYTARVGGDAEMVRQALPAPATRSILVSVRNTFSNAWYAFFTPADPTATSQALTVPLDPTVFPFSNLGVPKITGARLIFGLSPDLSSQMNGMSVAGAVQAGAGPVAAVTLTPIPGTTEDGVTPIAALASDIALPGAPGPLTLTAPLTGVNGPLTTVIDGQTRLDPALFEDIFLILDYALA